MPSPPTIAPRYELMQVGSDEDAGGRQREADGAEGKAFLLAEMVRYGSGSGAAGNATDQSAPGGPPRARCVEVEQLAQIGNRTADHDVVIAEKQAAQRGNRGGDDERDDSNETAGMEAALSSFLARREL